MKHEVRKERPTLDLVDVDIFGLVIFRGWFGSCKPRGVIVARFFSYYWRVKD